MPNLVGVTTAAVSVFTAAAVANVTGVRWEPVDDASSANALVFDLYAEVSNPIAAVLLADAGDATLTDPVTGLASNGLFVSGTGSLSMSESYFALGSIGSGQVGILRSMSLQAASVVDGAWFDPPGGQAAQPTNGMLLLGRFTVTSTQAVLGGSATASGQQIQSSLFISWTAGGVFSTAVFEIPSCRPNACIADFNQDGAVGVPDIFAFVAAWFAGDPRANVDGINGTAVPDIFAFLGLWFAGCA